jgi:uncharacterized repeat protein (TIGR01451 family)
MDARYHPLRRYRFLLGPCCLLLAAVLLLPSWIAADDTLEVLTERFTTEGQYAIAAQGVGMADSSTGSFLLDVPGVAVRAAYLFWGGYDVETGGDDTVSLAVDGSVAVSNLVADEVYGPALWFSDNYWFAYVADVTPHIAIGAHEYTVAQFGESIRRRQGTGLLVVYEAPDLPWQGVAVKDGLDRFFRGWGEGPRAESAVTCFDFAPMAVDRLLDLTLFVAGAEPNSPGRPSALWYLTGTDLEPQPNDMVNAPDGPPTGLPLQVPPDFPFTSVDGAQWDTYTNTVLVPAGDTWLCLQPESAEYQDLLPESAVWLAAGISLQVPGPSDLTVAKADAPDPVIPGEQLVYVLTYGNLGPSAAENTILSDLLPPEVTFVEANPDPTTGPNPLLWELGTVEAGEWGSVTVTVTVQPWVTGTFTNTVTITTETEETDYQNNRDDEPTRVTPMADVTVQKLDAPDPVIAGQQLLYTLVYTNQGPSDALDVVVTDLLPPGVTFVSALPPQTTGPNPLVWQLGTLAAGQSGSLVVTVTVQPWVTGTFTNTVTITTETEETDYQNNRDDEPTRVTPIADVTVQKLDAPDPVIAGQQLLYTLVYTNQGPSDALDVVVTDLLPPGVTFVSALPPQTTGPNPLVWQLGTLAAGESGSLTVTVTVGTGVTEALTNTVTIATSTPESDYDNNQDTERTDVILLADVAIEKLDSPDPARPGETLLYSLFYRNNGPAPATNVIVADLLPPAVDFVAAIPAQSTGPNPLLWNLGTLAPGQSGTIQVQVTVGWLATDTITNTVTIVTDTPESNYENNQDLEPTTIGWPPVAVELLYFRASPAGNQVLLEWETAWEQQNWGFFLYRAHTPNDEDAAWIHSQAAHGDAFDGAYYRYTDADVLPGETYYYWLEDVETTGQVTRHGPISVVARYGIYLPLVSRR